MSSGRFPVGSVTRASSYRRGDKRPHMPLSGRPHMPMSGRPSRAFGREYLNSRQTGVRAARITGMSNGAVRPRWLRWAISATGTVAVATISLYLYFIASFIWSQDCSVGFDTSNVPPPAPASPQGWLCGSDQSRLATSLWMGAFLASWLLTVVLIVLAWRRWSWRGGIPALLLIIIGPFVTTWALNLPADDCTAHTRSISGQGECVR
jgi:hypothetical protein